MKKNCLLALFVLFNITSIIAQNVDYSPLHNSSTFNRSLNINLPVGSLQGQGGVSAAGGATYSMSITIPPGTNGAIPSVSLDYNSQRGTGIIGMGWGLSGLSYISRATGTAYHDGSAQPIDLDLNDRFVLDGTRMVLKSGTYGTDGSTYGTEMENFATITAKGTSGAGPQWFEVITKEGLIMEYGRTLHSTVFKSSPGTVLIWALNKITYSGGNYILFNYINDATSVRISEISYTGNADIVPELLPYNKIKFEYKGRIDSNYMYENDIALGSNTLLDKITVTSESDLQIVATYQFNYAHDDINSYLKEVIKKGSDGLALNSTIFKYGDPPTPFNAGSSSVTQGTQGSDFTGDFNGDGVSDILSTETEVVSNNNQNYTYTKNFTIYSREFPSQDNSYGVDAKYTLPSNSLVVQSKKIFETSNFISSDYTGDGADDIFTAKTSFSGSQRHLDNLKIYRPIVNPAYPSSGLPYKIDSVEIGTNANRIHSSGNFVFSGDFNGDGVQDVLLLVGENVSGIYRAQVRSALYGTVMPFFGNIQTTGTVFFPTTTWATADQVHILDFNGDGKSDIMLIKDNDCEIFTIEGDLLNSPLARRIVYYPSGYFSKNDLFQFGDFNGDRKTDMLVRGSLTNNSTPWRRILSTGTDIFGEIFTFTQTPNIVGGYSDDHLSVGDFNGDGRSDIYHGSRIASGGSNLDVYYSKGIDFKHIRSTFSGALGLVGAMTADLNGDGRSDVINRKCYCEPFDIFYFKKEGQENLLEKVANGYNHIIEWSHKKLTDGDTFYVRGALTEHPLNSIQPPLYTVADFKSQNGIGGVSTIQYTYEGAKFHAEGKGLLGFSKLTENNLATGMKTVSENEFNTTYYTIAPYRKSTYLTSNSTTFLNQTTLTNTFVGLSGNRFWIKTPNINEDNAFEGRTIITENTYDTYNNITISKVTNKGGTNVVETTTTTTTYANYASTMHNKPTSVKVSNTRTGQGPSEITTTFRYNSIGQLTSKTDFSGFDKSTESVYTYFPLGNLAKTTITPAGMPERSTSATYDNKERYPITTTNVLNQISSATYDPKWGKPLTVIGIDGLTSSNEYDGFGKLKKTTHSEGFNVTQTYGWDLAGTATWYSLTDYDQPGKPYVKTWYDVLNREVKTETEGFTNGTVITQVKSYDQRGNVASSTQPYKSGENVLTNINTYDDYNRLVSSGNSIFGNTTITPYSYNSGNLSTTTTNPSGQTKSQVTDAAGRTISMTDQAGTVNYTYDSQGNILTVKAGNPTIITNTYDIYGKQTKLSDQNAGITSYDYDALGQLISETNATGNTHIMAYDLMGRITSRSGPDGPNPTTYEYYPSGTGILAASVNKIKKVTGFNGDTKEYTYDNFGRTASVTESINGVIGSTSYGYNIYGDITSIDYAPSGFGIRQEYNSNGYLSIIKNNDLTNPVTIYTNSGMNGLGQNTAYTLGNTKSSTITYHYGVPTQFLTAGIQNLEMSWNYSTGNLSQRKDNIKGKIEDFTYDNLNRLLTSTISGSSAKTITYENSGNISSKTDAGNYTYHATMKNAVVGITNTQSNIPLLQQDITYTPFMQPDQIKENGFQLNYTYGSDYERTKGVLTQNGSNIISTRYYFEDYERDESGSSTKYIHYVNSPAGLVAIVVKEGGTETYNYVYTDHLGSILTTTNYNATNFTAQQNFDAWGRFRNPDDWTYNAIPTPPTWLYRGYTSHEHLPQFGLINMNGRMYDPIVGRMLSPDNFLQGEFSQGYNRYSYALNNPLLNTDPDGQFVVAAIVVGAMIGSFVGMISASSKGQNELSGAWKGALVGGLGGLFGAFAPAGIIPGVLYGSGSGAIVGGLNAALFGNNVGKGALTGAVLGGIGGGISGGISAVAGRGNIWTGEFPTHEITAEEIASLGPMEGSKVNYSKSDLDSYVSRKFGKLNKLIKTSLDIPDGYTLNDNGSWKGSLPNSTGKVANGVLGITKRSTMAGGRFIRVNIAKPAFDSEELLFLISGHEFVHASHMLRNLDLKFSNQDFANLTEGGAWSWTMDAYHNNGWENLGRISNNYDIWGSYGQYTSAFLKYPLQTRNLFNFGTIRTIFKK